MDTNARFIFDGNVNRFADLLEAELSPDRRAQLQKLLILEENKYGFYEEQLVITGRRLTETRLRIARQRELISACTGDEELRRAQSVLNNMLVTRDLFQQFYDLVSEAVLQPRLRPGSGPLMRT